ncbi:MAG: hypothetical protein EOO02_17950 [Chitinophagaceae bacterium]|nr:MAG: hypothetical protein EOO02_17950 [Chitinophagaceae bacterium]
MKRISFLTLISITLLASCSKDDEPAQQPGEFKGAEVTLHLGKAWSVVKVDEAADEGTLI